MNNKRTIIDVRSAGEFVSGNATGTINIPLQEIQQRLEEVRQLSQPLVLCCASGNRSGQAAAFLKGHGIECENGGSWMEVDY